MSERGRATNRGVGQVYLLFGASLLLVLAVGGAIQLVSMTVGLAVTELLLILLPAVLFVGWKRIPIARAFRWRPVSAPIGLLSVAVGVTGWGVAAGILLLTVPVLGEPPEMPGLVARSWAELLLILVCAAALPALCEEALFRGAIQGVLWRRGARRAVVVTAILFGLFHVSPWSLLPAFFLGLVFGSMVERTGSTVSSMLAHFANNATAVTVGFVLAERPASMMYVLIAVLAAVFCVVFPMFWLSTRGAAPSPPALATVPAALPRLVAWIGGAVAAVAVLAVTAVIIAVIAVFDVYTVKNDDLEPAIQRGDRLITSTRNLESVSFEAGHIIAVRRDGEVALRWIARVDGETIWIQEDSGERVISRDQIVGRVIHTIPAERVSE